LRRGSFFVGGEGERSSGEKNEAQRRGGGTEDACYIARHQKTQKKTPAQDAYKGARLQHITAGKGGGAPREKDLPEGKEIKVEGTKTAAPKKGRGWVGENMRHWERGDLNPIRKGRLIPGDIEDLPVKSIG